jgi:hypothetical protein
MADKYIALLAGLEQEVEGTVAGGTAAQNGKIVALGTDGKLDASLMPVGIAADVFATTAGEALTAGDFVYITATGTARKASATSGGNPAVGFVLTSAANAASVTVYFEGSNTALTGLTVGARYYLSSATAGGVTATPVSGAGTLHQFLGRAYSATAISTEIDDHIVRA